MVLKVEHFTFQRIFGSISLLLYIGLMLSIMLDGGLTNWQVFQTVVTIGLISLLLRGKYEAKEEYLNVKQGMFSFHLRYEDISRIVDHTEVDRQGKKKGVNKIEIFYGKNDYIILTPRNKEELEHVFHERCPHVVIKRVAV
jgi:Bacterial PH domain